MVGNKNEIRQVGEDFNPNDQNRLIVFFGFILPVFGSIM